MTNENLTIGALSVNLYENLLRQKKSSSFLFCNLILAIFTWTYTGKSDCTSFSRGFYFDYVFNIYLICLGNQNSK